MSSRSLNADGLRGLASLSVVFAHYVAAFHPSLLAKSFPSLFEPQEFDNVLYQAVDSPLISLLYNGQFAVLIFFVLSGYVLTLPFYSSENCPQNTLRKRIWGRYLRLNIPIFVTVIISFCLYRSGLYFNGEVASHIGNDWFLKYFSSQFSLVDALEIGLLGGVLHGNGDLNPPLWTIKVEFLGSLILMSTYLVFEKRHYLVLSIVILTVYFYSGVWAVYYAAIFAGVSISSFKFRTSVNYVILGVGVYFGSFQHGSVFYEFLPHPMADSRLLYNFLGAYLLVLAIIQGVGKGLLQAEIVQFLGRISYSLYIVHFLILSSFASFSYLNVDYEGWTMLIHFSLYISICVGVAYVFSVLVDEPSIVLSKRFSNFMTR